MKRIVVILFAAVVVYGGVAWALGPCLVHAADHEHSTEEHNFHRHGSTILSDEHAPFSPVFHCPTPELRIGPAAQSGPVRLKDAQKVATAQAISFYGSPQPRLGHGRWLDAVFRSLLPFSQAGNTGRYLLFSVLQI